jgi:Tfp pilus assembly protein PilX
VKISKRYKTGSALVAVVILTWVLFTLVTSYINVMLSEKRLILASENNLQAMAVAEAGLEDAFWQFLHNSALFTDNGWTLDTTTNLATKSVSNFTTSYNAAIGSYNVQVQNVSTSTPLITSTGTIDGAGTATTAIVKSSIKANPLYSNALLAKGQIEIKNNAVIDSYDSSQGIYNADLGGSQFNKYQNGHAQTNATASDAICLAQNAVIQGNATTGIGGGICNPSNVTGATDQLTPTTINLVTVPSTLTSLSSGGVLDIGNNTEIAFQSGSYKYTNIQTGNNAVIRFQGDVKIYVTENVDVGNGANFIVESGATLTIYADETIKFGTNTTIDNQSSSPSNLTFYGTSSNTEVNFQNNSAIYAVVNAPDAVVRIRNNGDFYGSVIGSTIEVDNNTNFHYDEDLKSTGPKESYKMTWWRKM